MDCSLPGSSVHWIFQARVLEWGAIAFSTIKDRNSKDLTEAEEITKRWQGYTELYEKDLNDPDNHNGVVTHLEPDMLECEVKRVLLLLLLLSCSVVSNSVQPHRR